MLYPVRKQGAAGMGLMGIGRVGRLLALPAAMHGWDKVLKMQDAAQTCHRPPGLPVLLRRDAACSVPCVLVTGQAAAAPVTCS